MCIAINRTAIAALFVLSSAFNGQVRAANEEVAVVVKIGGIPWFNAMEKGIQKAGKEDNLNAYMIGPTSADPAQQVRAVEDLIAKKVKVIAVVPNDAKALDARRGTLDQSAFEQQAAAIQVRGSALQRKAQLRDRLQIILRNRRDKAVYLKADRNLAYGVVVETMDVLNRLGVENLGMVTELKSESGK